MAISRGPKIVTNGLVLALDAGDNNSFAAIDLPIKNGLVMWMDASDDTSFSYSSGTTVSQWRDKSGFNHHMAPVSAGPTRNAFLNSRKVLAFTTTQQIRNTTLSLFSSANTVFVICRYAHASLGRGRILTSDESANNWLLGNYGNGVNRYYANGWVNLSYDAPDTTWRIYMGDWGGPSNDLANFYSNGTAGNTNNPDASQGPASLCINRYYAETSNCEVSEIIVFNRVLSATERRLVHTYLGQKWGIVNTDKSIIDISGNNNTGSFGGAAGSQNVANMPTFDFYNKGALRFDGGDYVLTATPVLPSPHTSPFTLESFCCPSTVSVAYQTVLGTMNSFSQIGFVNNTFAAGRNGGGGGFLRNSLATVFANTWYHICMTYDGTNASFYLNGSFLSTQTIGTNGINNGVSLLGSYSSNSPSETFNGTIGSARIYNRALTATEVLQNYNAQKSKYTDTVVQSGLMLHLDAENPSSYSGGGTVWYDVSGNGYNAGMNNITPSNWVTYNGVKAFETNDTNNQNFTVGSFPFPQSGRTYEIWINSKSFSLGWQSWFDDGGGERVLFGTSTNTIHVYPSVEVSANLVAGQWYQLLYTMAGGNGTAVVVYKDGQAIGSGTYGYALSSGTGILFILGDSGSEITSCYCSTVRVYNRVLSAAEVLQNYNATKSRFGL